MLRRTLLCLAVLPSLAAPAMAGDIQTGGVPLVSTNVANNFNVAAGIGNTAFQGVGQSQKGSGGPLVSVDPSVSVQRGGSGSPLVTTNVATNLNLAAGIGNTAFQGVGQSQGGRSGFTQPLLLRR